MPTASSPASPHRHPLTGILTGTPFAFALRGYTPTSRRKAGDVCTSTPQLAVELLQELPALGFRFSVVLADRMYGESWDVPHALHRLELLSIVAIRSNHVVWLPPGDR